MPRGKVCIEIPKSFMYQNVLVIPAAFPPYPPDTNEAKEISGETIWMLKALSGLPYQNPNFPGILYMQLMYPSGRVMQNVLADISPDLGFGSGRTIFDEPIPCPVGSKFFITLDTSISGNSSDVGINLVTGILFEGAYRYFLKSNAAPRTTGNSSANMPRFYFDSPNQNLMAPEWMVSNRDGSQCHDECPAGFRDQAFTYSNTNGAAPLGPAVFSEAAPKATSIIIPIESSTDFLCRRIMFAIEAGNVAPTFFIRLRTSLGGSSITNDYIPMASRRFHKDWFLRRGIQAYIDVFGITNGGDGNTTVYAYLEGVKRGRP
jgi:hypothetical protein